MGNINDHKWNQGKVSQIKLYRCYDKASRLKGFYETGLWMDSEMDRKVKCYDNAFYSRYKG